MKLDGVAWQRWVDWIGSVRIDLRSALTDRIVFRGFNDVVRENELWIGDHYGAWFCEFIVHGYIARVATAVRRHSRDHKDAVTLDGLLDQMEKCAPQFTFDFYVEHRGGDAENDFLQRATFKYVSEDGHVASEKLIRRDIDELQRLTSKVEAFVDMHLAHLDRRQVPLVATFNDLDDALNGLDRIACKYLTLLTGSSRATLAPTIQEPWTDIFNVPLHKP